MATTRERLRLLVDALPESVLDSALEDFRKIVRAYLPESPEDALEELDRWMIEHGWMTEIPQPEAAAPRKIERLRIPGKPVSETLIEERR